MTCFKNFLDHFNSLTTEIRNKAYEKDVALLAEKSKSFCAKSDEICTKYEIDFAFSVPSLNDLSDFYNNYYLPLCKELKRVKAKYPNGKAIMFIEEDIKNKCNVTSFDIY